jgi:hypothetical protein
MRDNSEKIGLWEADREEIATAPLTGTGLYSALDQQLDFRVAVLRLLATEFHESVGTTGDTAYFVLADRQLFETVARTCDRVPMLQSSEMRSRPLSGNLWFVPRALAQGFARDTRSLSSEDVFRIIEDFGAGGYPTIVLVQQKSEFCPAIFSG